MHTPQLETVNVVDQIFCSKLKNFTFSISPKKFSRTAVVAAHHAGLFLHSEMPEKLKKKKFKLKKKV
jgi:hypothetical protein